MIYIPPMPRDVVKRAKRNTVTHLFFDDPPPGRRELLASMDSKWYRAGNERADSFDRSSRHKRNREKARESGE